MHKYETKLVENMLSGGRGAFKIIYFKKLECLSVCLSVCLSTKLFNKNSAPLGHLTAHTPKEECMAYNPKAISNLGPCNP